jgi:uncharacterized membrane protein YphA (DoxX/SURF4 family)
MMNKQGWGLALLRIALGVFFLFEGIGKLAWLTDSGILAGRLSGWFADAGAGSASRWYLSQVAMPGASLFARLVPLGELAAGVAFLTGVWTRPAATLAFLMVLNIHLASGALFRTSFLTNGYALPVLGGTLALALGGARLPLSLKK